MPFSSVWAVVPAAALGEIDTALAATAALGRRAFNMVQKRDLVIDTCLPDEHSHSFLNFGILMTKRGFLCIAATITMLITAPVLAEQASEARDCHGPEGSSLYEGCTIGHSIHQIERKIEKIITETVRGQPRAVVRNFLAAQRSWKQYRMRACDSASEILGGLNSISYARCQHELTEQRLEFLTHVTL